MSNAATLTELRDKQPPPPPPGNGEDPRRAARTFPQMLTAFKEQIALALPKHLNADRMARIALTCFRMQPLLAKCAPESVFAAVIQASQLGLEPGLNGQAYLVPFWNNKKSQYECQMIPGYRGLITLARRSGEIESISAQIVYANDVCDFQLGTDEKLIHRPRLDGERGEPLFTYCIAKFKSGGMHIEPMAWTDVMRIKARTKSRNKNNDIVGPWVTDEEEMARKTVVRRASKYWPMSVEMATALSMDNLAAKGLSQGVEINEAIKGDYMVMAEDDEQQQAALTDDAGGEPVPPAASAAANGKVKVAAEPAKANGAPSLADVRRLMTAGNWDDAKALASGMEVGDREAMLREITAAEARAK